MTRKVLPVLVGLVIASLLHPIAAHAATGAPSGHPNVLFFAVDDMNDWTNLLQWYAGKNHRYQGSQVARFNLSWLLDGEATEDGEVPTWVRATKKE